MNHDSFSASRELYQAYAEKLKRLLPEGAGLAFLASNGAVRWSSFTPATLDERVLDRLRASVTPACHDAQLIYSAELLATIPVLDGKHVVGAVLVPIAPNVEESPDESILRTWRRLRPVLDRLGSDLGECERPERNAAVLSERTEELEWLFGVTARLDASMGETHVIEKLLAAAVERLNASFGALMIPGQQLCLTYASPIVQDTEAVRAHQHAAPNLMSHIHRSATPFIANGLPNETSGTPVRKILALPVTHLNGRIAGMLVFYKPASLTDFGRRQLYLGRHIARHVESILTTRHDLATGLLTRLAVERDAARIIAARPGEPHSLVCIDIDHLHIVNESFGFDFGDQAILRIANLLQAPCLPQDTIAGRLAGDRFVAFLPGCDAVQTTQYVQAFQSEVKKLAVGLQPRRITLSVSCGIAQVPQISPAFAKGLAAAELACRTAKERGRDRSEVYLDVDDSMMHRHGDILSVVRLRAALDKDRLTIFAQKIAPLRDVTRTAGLECLVRLVAEDGEFVAPVDFLSAARRYQLSRAIDEWMFDHMLVALQPYSSMLFHAELYTSINISEQSLCDGAFLRNVENRIGQADIAPGLIMFEVAEGIATRNATVAEAFKRRVKKLGCLFALDDFGTEANSLGLLQTLRPDRVKIDGGFARDLLSNARAEAFIGATVKLAEGLDIDCVAEYAESAAIARRLRELGVGYAQGNSLHEAEPLTSVLDSLNEEESRQLQRMYREK